MSKPQLSTADAIALYRAERDVRRKRDDAAVEKAKAEFEAHYAAPRAKGSEGGRPTTIERDRQIARDYANGTPKEVIAANRGLTLDTVTRAIFRARRAGEIVPDNPVRDRAIYEDTVAGVPMYQRVARYNLGRKRIQQIAQRERKRQGQNGRAA